MAQFAAHGADAFFTYQDKHSQNFVERDPMARPFVHNDAIFIAGSAVGLFSELVIERELRKRGHRKIADAIALVSISGHTWGATYSAINHVGADDQRHFSYQSAARRR